MSMDLETLSQLARRYFLQDSALGLGGLALTSLLSGSKAWAKASPDNPLALKPPHFAPKAKRVIFLFMGGGPSQLDLFDPKPALKKYEGQQVPDEVLRGADLPFIERDAALMASPFKFAQYGQSGAVVSELLPHLAEVVDEIALVRSMHTDAFNHAPAQIFLNTGHLQLGRPSMGAWVTYGLGCESENLPAFVVLNPGNGPSGGAACWGSGFLPSVHQGALFRAKGDPILFVSSPPGHTTEMQRESLNVINQLNQQHLDVERDPEIYSRINAYEMAFRLQGSAPELMDLKDETQATLDLYGVIPGQKSVGATCLMSRRLIERGVRFVSVLNVNWDHHTDVESNLKQACGQIDKPVTALIKDLKQRGLLDDTLVVWAGEFGRTPMVENNPALGRTRGRDHHPNAFTVWLAGGGIKPGQTIGVTDELGYHVIEDPIHVHDLQATILHLLGLDHTKLTYRYQGRDFRLTDVGGNVVQKLLA